MSLSRPKAILSFSHTDYHKCVGGLEKFIVEQSKICREQDYTFIGIFPIAKPVKLGGKTVGHKFKRFGVIVNLNEAIYLTDVEVIDFLKKYAIEKIFIHTLICLPIQKVFDIIDSTGCNRIYYYVHDYASLCFSHVLLKNKKGYCGSDRMCLAKCYNCRYYPFNILYGNKYRQLFERYASMHYIFPSVVAEEVWSKTYGNIPDRKKHIIPHQRLSDKLQHFNHPSDTAKIAYVGYKAVNKGWATFRKLVEESRQRNLPYEFYVLGRSDEILEGVEYVDVSFQDDGPDAMVKAIKENKIDIAFLWSPWPETYSYTFFESYVGGAFIVTNKESGNIAYQTKKLKCGIVFSDEEQLFSSIESLKGIVSSTKRPEYLVPSDDFLFL